MRRIVVLAVIFLGLLPQQASAYTDRGLDPNEPEGRYPSHLDIHSSRRTLLQVSGESRLVLHLDVYGPEPMGDWWDARVMLDTRDGPDVDFLLRIWNWDMTGHGCSVEPLGNPADRVNGHFKQVKDLAKCRISAASIDTDKRIRWWLRIASHSKPEKRLDRAPDEGWYPKATV